MNFVQFVTLLVILVASYAFAEVSEEEMKGLKKVFCEEKNKDMADAMKPCFETVKPSEEAEKIMVECCEGMEIPVTGDSVQAYTCSHSTEEMLQCMKCQDEKFEEAGNKENYESVMEPLKECMKEKVKEASEK